MPSIEKTQTLTESRALLDVLESGFERPVYLTPEVPAISAKMREVHADFQVDEVHAYPPLGEGDHTLIRIEKEALSTPEAIRRLADRLEVSAEGAGYSGLKDRNAVTRQWISLPKVDPEAAMRVECPQLRVLEAARHPHKLRTGHLRANRFALRLRQVETGRLDDLEAILESLGRQGVPNFYGPQRFGRGKLESALRWLAHPKRAPRSRFDRKFIVSVLQAALYNLALADRMERGDFARILPGDLLRREDSGGLFVEDDRQAAEERHAAWEVSITGPIFGSRMPAPQGEAAEREQALLQELGLTIDHFERFGRLARGTRRPYRVALSNCRLEKESESVIVLHFELPSGSYATALMREILKGKAGEVSEPSREP